MRWAISYDEDHKTAGRPPAGLPVNQAAVVIFADDDDGIVRRAFTAIDLDNPELLAAFDSLYDLKSIQDAGVQQIAPELQPGRIAGQQRLHDV